MASRKIDYLDFFKTVGKSKRLLRSGWVREGIKDPESVAEHSFRVGVLAVVLSDKLGVDKEKLIKMAFIHDIGEVITGDVVSVRGEVVDIEKRHQKEQQERKGIRAIFDKIGEGERYAAIFNEMVDNTTVEAKIFRAMDKLEMALQAFEYEEEQGKDLKEFFINTALYITEPLLREIFKDILKKRAKKEISLSP